MKKLFQPVVAAVMLLIGAVPSHAQVDLSGIISGVSKAAQTASGAGTGSLADGLTTIFSASKVAKASDLVGNWSYQEPAVVFTSSNILKNAGGKLASTAIEKKLQQKLSSMGITKGKMKMTFDKAGNFTQTVAGKTLKGTYTCSGKNVVLKYGGTTNQMIGTTQVDGKDLLIVMDASKLLGYFKTLGTLSGSASLKAASSFLSSMDGMQCGLRLTK